MRYDKSNRKIFDLKSSDEEFVFALEEICDWVGCLPDTVFKKVIPMFNGWHLGPRENHLVAMAFGASIAGNRPAVLMQNSGLGLSLDAIMGTFSLYKKGLLLVISNRGILEWEEIQHKEWGTITESLLSAANIEIIEFDKEGIFGLKRAGELAFNNQKVVALLIQRGNLNE